jgi:hypothetical protein
LSDSSSQNTSRSWRAQVAVYLLAALLTLLALNLLLNFLLVVVLPDTIADEVVQPDGTNWFVLVLTINSLLLFLLFIATVVAFLMWLHEAYVNLASLGTFKPEYTPGWAVGWFFVPFANLVMPYKVVDELWVKSDPMLKEPVEESWQKGGSSSLVGWWWGFWIISNIANRAANRLSSDAETADQLFTAAKVEIVADALTIIAGILVIMVIRGIDKRQEMRRRSFQQSNLPPPPPTFSTQQI